jgi:hypothetical protein
MTLRHPSDTADTIRDWHRRALGRMTLEELQRVPAHPTSSLRTDLLRQEILLRREIEGQEPQPPQQPYQTQSQAVDMVSALMAFVDREVLDALMDPDDRKVLDTLIASRGRPTPEPTPEVQPEPKPEPLTAWQRTGKFEWEGE